jgi:transposase, IS5 family
MSWADGRVQSPRGNILDKVEAVVDWTPPRSLIGKRDGDGPGQKSCFALACRIWHNLPDPALEAAIADRLSFRRFDRTPDQASAGTGQGRPIEKIPAEINRQLEAKKTQNWVKVVLWPERSFAQDRLELF